MLVTYHVSNAHDTLINSHARPYQTEISFGYFQMVLLLLSAEHYTPPPMAYFRPMITLQDLKNKYKILDDNSRY